MLIIYKVMIALDTSLLLSEMLEIDKYRIGILIS